MKFVKSKLKTHRIVIFDKVIGTKVVQQIGALPRGVKGLAGLILGEPLTDEKLQVAKIEKSLTE